MNLDPVSIGQHVLVVIAFFVFCWLWTRFARLVFGWGAILLFCIGEYGWAFLALLIWYADECAHRRFMAEERAAGFYNGPWVD